MATYKKSGITKEAIRKAAADLFLEQGYIATTVRDICKVSGVSLSRLNYHFSSKADLAADICRELLRNFYTELKKAIRNDRDYSLVVEAISLRFIVDLVIDAENRHEASIFYRDLAAEGIFGSTFTPSDQGEFSKYMSMAHFSNIQSLTESIGIYSRIFGSSFSAVASGWNDLLVQYAGDEKKALRKLQDVYAGLFMQMMDIPHEAQQAMVEISAAYYEVMEVELEGLTCVKVAVKNMPTLRDKIAILENIVESEKIRLKSTVDRRDIELNTDID